MRYISLYVSLSLFFITSQLAHEIYSLIATSVLLLQSLGILFVFQIMLKKSVSQVTPVAPQHLHTSIGIQSGQTALNASSTSNFCIFRKDSIFSSKGVIVVFLKFFSIKQLIKILYVLILYQNVLILILSILH